MKRKIVISVILIIGLAGLYHGTLYYQSYYNHQWPSFRGPRACGYMINSKTPAKWDIENTKDIKWKTPIPGLAHSCPVIWDNYLFVTTATTYMNDESLKLGLINIPIEAKL